MRNASGRKYIWHEQTIRKMLHDPTYTGAMVGNKRPTVSFQLKKRVKSSPDELVIIEDMHEPIISKEDFETVQRMLEKRHKEVDLVPKGVLNGVLKCAECGKRCPATVRKTEKTVSFTAAAPTAITEKPTVHITSCQA